MSAFLKKLVTTLNQDITISFRSVDDAGAQVDAMESQDKDEADDQLRYLSLDDYTHHTIPRKSETPFQLRYAPYGESSNVLCAHSYAWSAQSTPPSQGSPNALALAIEFEGHPAAAATVVFDTQDVSLSVKDKFAEQYKLKKEKHGDKLCELTSFAISKVKKSRRTLAGLMHMIFLYTRQSRHMQGMFVQTREHYAGVFEKMFGFEVSGKTENTVLLFIAMDAMRQNVRKYAGKSDIDQEEAGLYKFFFEAKDEAGLLFRMLEHLAASGTSEG